MKTSNISNMSLSNALRSTVQKAQIDLIKANYEATEGKYFDVGATLGVQTAVSIDLNREIERIKALQSTNSIATQRLESSQEAMGQMEKAAQKIKEQLLIVQGTRDQSTLTAANNSVIDAFDTFTSAANTAVAGEFLFAGINSDVKPLDNYLEAGSSAKAAFDAAFLGYFGFNQSAAGVNSIAATGSPSMEEFLTTVVEPMFDGTDWANDWSSATDATMTNRISQTEIVQTSTSINADGMKKFALSAVVAKELIGLNLQEATRSKVIEKAIQYNNEAISGINAERTKLGLSETRVKKADDSLAIQKDILSNNLTDLIGVDAYESATRVKNLEALINTSYTLTARIQQLSLVNFL
ncbi:flagellar hook-associated family protein [Rhizobium sp. RU36D]|uniref:flagellar hook-associated family protein n=1 Tax=Rhizobium sp. RU36D TaxID=1907415 RepID=UPI0009D7F5F9|nr:flagellar hook-associated family protein [Rhizobium sp. RU36D]SMC84951.1 flagellar hook-associated protein 3 FlgL [Rhizobium sp. RU36D]